jgi:hypothetical protein
MAGGYESVGDRHHDLFNDDNDCQPGRNSSSASAHIAETTNFNIRQIGDYREERQNMKDLESAPPSADQGPLSLLSVLGILCMIPQSRSLGAQ